jgi:hypothetical protein
MNETGLVHPLVAGYLRQFGAAASILPVPRGPRAARAGRSPYRRGSRARGQRRGDRSRAARPGLPGPSAGRGGGDDGQAVVGVAARLGGWTLVGVLVLAAAAVSGYFIRIDSLGPLIAQGSGGWPGRSWLQVPWQTSPASCSKPGCTATSARRSDARCRSFTGCRPGTCRSRPGSGGWRGCHLYRLGVRRGPPVCGGHGASALATW